MKQNKGKAPEVLLSYFGNLNVYVHMEYRLLLQECSS